VAKISVLLAIENTPEEIRNFLPDGSSGGIISGTPKQFKL